MRLKTVPRDLWRRLWQIQAKEVSSSRVQKAQSRAEVAACCSSRRISPVSTAVFLGGLAAGGSTFLVSRHGAGPPSLTYVSCLGHCLGEGYGSHRGIFS